MFISFCAYLKKFFDLEYEDYLLISSDEKRNFYFTEYQRYIYDGEIKLTIHHHGR